MVDITLEKSYQTPYANSVLLPLLLFSLAKQKHSPETSSIFHNEYDYIIVGAGAAGSVVASRLAELECAKILLLEAGKAPPLLTEVPALATNFWYTDLDWQFKTVPQKYTAKGLNNSQVVWPLAKAIGGCSILNYMVYIRGNRKNYDNWEREGADGWGYQDVLPYFIKSEDNRDPKYLQNGFHGVGGPLTVESNGYESILKDSLIEAVHEHGYKFVDPNGFQQTGFYDFQATFRDKQRCSTAKAYLVPAEDCDNLDILPGSFVKKIIFKGKRAIGVVFDFKNLTYFVRARKEVIVSAGSVNSAKLLMLSGVGPKEHLKHLNIPVITDLPVGKNLHDHAGTTLMFEMDSSIPTVKEKLNDPDALWDYIENRKGPLTSTQFINLIGFLKDKTSVSNIDFPDFKIIFREANIEFLKSKLNFKAEITDSFKGLQNKSLFLCTIGVLQPFSRGTVRLQSSDPHDPPLIDPNYFQDPRDIKMAVKGLKTCLKIATESEAMINIGAKPLLNIESGCDRYANDTDYHLECIARSTVTTLFHPVGTAKMGSVFDPTSVVDPQLRVIGVDGLRVVDASVMPIIPSGHTYSPTVMVAEKAADIIKASFDCSDPYY